MSQKPETASQATGGFSSHPRLLTEYEPEEKETAVEQMEPGGATASAEISAIAFVGKKNSGKTTLLVQVVAELAARGLRVGTVKHHSHAGFDFDVEGKDSWRHRQAGSAYTVIAAPDQVASVRSLAQELPLEQIIAEMRRAARDEQGRPTLDLILAEGYRHGGLPTIELFRADNPNDAQRELGGEGNQIIAVVTDIARVAAAARAAQPPLPVFGFADIAALADFVAQSRQ